MRIFFKKCQLIDCSNYNIDVVKARPACFKEIYGISQHGNPRLSEQQFNTEIETNEKAIGALGREQPLDLGTIQRDDAIDSTGSKGALRMSVRKNWRFVAKRKADIMSRNIQSRNLRVTCLKRVKCDARNRTDTLAQKSIVIPVLNHAVKYLK
jgi:hypothetical protein